MSKYGKLRPEVKTKWVEALRSGEFLQGTGRLHRTGAVPSTDRLCCLGVLCEIALQDGVVKPTRYPDEVAYDNEAAMPPASVFDWAFEEKPDEFDDTEWPVPYRVIDDDGLRLQADKSLAELNDNGATFDEIAALVEQYL